MAAHVSQDYVQVEGSVAILALARINWLNAMLVPVSVLNEASLFVQLHIVHKQGASKQQLEYGTTAHCHHCTMADAVKKEKMNEEVLQA